MQNLMINLVEQLANGDSEILSRLILQFLLLICTVFFTVSMVSWAILNNHKAITKKTYKRF